MMMNERSTNKIVTVVFLLVTVYLIYAHFNANANHEAKLEGLAKLVSGQGAKIKINLDERYLVMRTKSASATIIPYTFVVAGKEYKGTMAALNKSFGDLANDSAYYLPEEPGINAVYPKADYDRTREEGLWNWRLYLAVLTTLGTLGGLMKIREDNSKNKK